VHYRKWESKVSNILSYALKKSNLFLEHGFLISVLFRNYQGVESVLNTLKSAGIERGQMTYFALLLAAIDNGKPIAEYLKGMEANNIGISEQQHAKILSSLARANNTKLLSLVRISEF
jgi:hypothetical protein